jgi:acetylornithine deacetylase/succinyl-diaminopimelate desuccinylase family protein
MDSLEQLLSDLVAIPSMNPMGRGREGVQYSEGALAGFIVEYLRRATIDVETDEVAPGRPNVIARFEAGARETLLLEAHLDTVFADRMTIEPFRPEIRNGRLYGRGACDTKGSLAAFLHVLRSCAEGKQKPAFNILLLATADEEYGFTGAKRAVAQGVKANFGIVGEPTGLHIVRAHKGVTRWKVVTHGVAAHSAYPDRGKNAIYGMAQIVARLERHAATLLGQNPHPVLGTPTLSVGIIEGGQTVNIVPDRCMIEVDRRTLPGETDASVLAAVRADLADVSGWEIVGPHLSIAGMEVSADHAIVRKLDRAVNDVIGKSVIESAQYATDAGVFNSHRIPTVVFGPGNIARAHTEEEYIELDQLHDAARIIQRILE